MSSFIILSLNKKDFKEVIDMAKRKKNPSKAGISAASVKGDAGPTVEADGGGKVNSQNNQFKK